MDGYQPYAFPRGEVPPPPPQQQHQNQPPNPTWYPAPYPPAPPRHPWPAPPSQQWPPQQQWPPYHQLPPPHAAPYPPPRQPVAGPWHSGPMPPPPSNFPPRPSPEQAWAKPSWSSSQMWEQQDRNSLHNEEDWASKAKAWASANSGTENFQAQPHAMTMGMVGSQNYAYNEQYRQPPETVRPFQHQSSFHQIPGQLSEQQNETTFQPSTSFNSASTMYTSDGGAQVVTGENNQASSSSFSSIRHTYEQEVPYNYSSSSVKEGPLQDSVSHVLQPSVATPNQDSFPHHPSAMPAPPQHLYSQEGIPALLNTDMSDQPLVFNNRPDPSIGIHQTINHHISGPGHGVPGGPLRVVDQDPMAISSHQWTPAVSTGLYPQASLPPVGRQLEPLVVSQPSIPVNSQPLFGAVSGPHYRPPIQHLPFGGSALTSTSTENFPSDLNGLLLERPKKVLPKWFQEELLKNKSSAGSRGQQSGVLNSMGAEDVETSLEKSHESESKSIDSAKSAEDDDDDEDEVQAAQTAAVNQEIKRVLTEVLLKVTDDLFAEIAAKVLNEDDSFAGASETASSAVLNLTNLSSPIPKAHGSSAESALPNLANSSAPISKEHVKIIVPANLEKNNANSGGANHSHSDTEKNILGLANYASDDDDDDDDGDGMSKDGTLKSGSLVPDPAKETSNQDYSNTLRSVGDNNGGNIEHTSEVSMGASDTHLTDDVLIQTTSSISSHMLSENSPKSERTRDRNMQLSDTQVDTDGQSGATASEQVHSTSKEDSNNFQCSNGNVKGLPPTSGGHQSADSKSTSTILRPEKEGDMVDTFRKESKDVSCRPEHDTSVRLNHKVVNERRNTQKESVDLKHSSKEKEADCSALHEKSHSKGALKHHDARGSREDFARDTREKYKDSMGRRDYRNEMDRSRQVSKDSITQSRRRSPSPSSRSRRRSPSPRGRSRTRRDNSYDEVSDKLKRRQVSRSPHSKSHTRHSPYNSTERRSPSRAAPSKRRR